MSPITRSLSFALLLCLPALTADHVTLANGDTITGTIIKKDGDKLTVKSEFLGEVSMPWKAVKAIKSDSELSVVLPSGETVKGKVDTEGTQLEVVTVGQVKSTELAGVTAVRDAAEQTTYERLQHPSLLELWKGNFDFGLTVANGNARSETVTNSFGAARATRNDKIAVYFNQIYGTARVNNLTSAIASAIRGGWKYNRNFTPRVFVSGFNDYEHDRFQNLDLRFVTGAGFGVNLLKTEHSQLAVDAGGDYERENFMDGLLRNSMEANFGDVSQFKISKALVLTQAMRVFTNLSNPGEYRLNFDLGNTTPIKKWLGWNVTASDHFLSNPVQGRLRNDLIITTGFRLTFVK